MKKFYVAGLFFFFALGHGAAFAATTPALGAAATYSILSSTFTNTSAGTTIVGDIGFTTPPAIAPLGVHTNYGSGPPYAAAGTAQGSLLSALASQPCTFTFAPGAINLSTDTTHGPIGVYAPGVYCSVGAMNVGGPLTLSGSGTYIFRTVGALNTTAGSAVTLLGASPCDIFWTPSAATTLAANTLFAGTVIDDAGITVGANTTWVGRALSFGGTVTTDTDTITAPVCPSPSSSTTGGTLSGTTGTTTSTTTSTTSGSLSGTVLSGVVVVPVGSSTTSGTLSGSIAAIVSSAGGGGGGGGGSVVSALTPTVAPVSSSPAPAGIVLGTSTVLIPGAPNTGSGGAAPANLAYLLISACFIAAGILCLRREQEWNFIKSS